METGTYTVSTDPSAGRPRTLEEIQVEMYGRPTPAKRPQAPKRVPQNANLTFGNRRYALHHGAQRRLNADNSFYERLGKARRKDIKRLRHMFMPKRSNHPGRIQWV